MMLYRIAGYRRHGRIRAAGIRLPEALCTGLDWVCCGGQQHLVVVKFGDEASQPLQRAPLDGGISIIVVATIIIIIVVVTIMIIIIIIIIVTITIGTLGGGFRLKNGRRPRFFFFLPLLRFRCARWIFVAACGTAEAQRCVAR